MLPAPVALQWLLPRCLGGFGGASREKGSRSHGMVALDGKCRCASWCPVAAGRGQARTWLRDLADPGLQAPPPAPSGARESRRLYRRRDVPAAHQGASRWGGCHAVRCNLLLPLASLQLIPSPSLSLHRKSPSRAVTLPSDQPFPMDRSLFIIAAAPSRRLCSSRAAQQQDHHSHVFTGSSPKAGSICLYLEAADGG